VHDIARRDNAEQLFSYAAGGFRDFTRIASSHPEMWRDICIANRDRLLAELGRYQDKLGGVGRLLQAGDAAGLEKLFAEARQARDQWLKSSS
jgi:prephenate dehydrogenase